MGADAVYTSERGYGFADASKVTVQDRGTSDPVKSDFATFAVGGQFNVDLPNGDYTVSLVAGDAAGATEIAIDVESMNKVQLNSKAAGEYLEMDFDIALVDGQMNLVFSGTAANLNALVITKQAEREAGSKPVLYLAGDSTMQTYNPYWEPQAGWGQMFPSFSMTLWRSKIIPLADAVPSRLFSKGGWMKS